MKNGTRPSPVARDRRTHASKSFMAASALDVDRPRRGRPRSTATRTPIRPPRATHAPASWSRRRGVATRRSGARGSPRPPARTAAGSGARCPPACPGDRQALVGQPRGDPVQRAQARIALEHRPVGRAGEQPGHLSTRADSSRRWPCTGFRSPRSSVRSSGPGRSVRPWPGAPGCRPRRRPDPAARTSRGNSPWAAPNATRELRQLAFEALDVLPRLLQRQRSDRAFCRRDRRRASQLPPQRRDDRVRLCGPCEGSAPRPRGAPPRPDPSCEAAPPPSAAITAALPRVHAGLYRASTSRCTPSPDPSPRRPSSGRDGDPGAPRPHLRPATPRRAPPPPPPAPAPARSDRQSGGSAASEPDTGQSSSGGQRHARMSVCVPYRHALGYGWRYQCTPGLAEQQCPYPPPRAARSSDILHHLSMCLWDR